MILGLVGRKQTGKSVIAQYLKEKYGFKEFAFADSLKQMLLRAGICTYEELYVEKTEFSRSMLQKVGTDIFRNQVDKNFWIYRLAPELNPMRVAYCLNYDGGSCVISDIRFLNEAEYIKSIGGTLIRVVRKLDAIDEHPSETEQDDISVDYKILNKGTIEDLYVSVNQIVEKCDFNN